ncbi:Ac122-like protein [Bombyx mandarina nucleopolyhedrovirus]|uniref:Orf122 n=2 Tax=Bombyx mori nuclear polyhedrosis virus TaxID=271108 RepID=I6V9K6_NPVBM|nr:Ac122-like protein [Bombyx mandarina nucleopolyhedrovirus]AFN09028.1 hypothetical protein Bmnpvcubicgp104 [Bombyx mori nucleopolyhedrovirus]AFN21077.1 hypothetical protein Bmnpvzhejianggp104 [Bombyx mori nucleopolyhedrovirus]AFN21217.1 hypothetical protein Bmnpvindiagp103 [Bombyx mori nucleopolyhedrovirus]AFN21357.1 hypothetical protein Bmnpvguangxigp105 [Bombyx mori nucleopolyhedrovirus]
MKLIILLFVVAAFVTLAMGRKSLKDPLKTTAHFGHPEGLKHKIRRPYNKHEDKLIQCKIYL